MDALRVLGLTLLLVALKLSGVIGWPWLLVWAPVLVPVLGVLGFTAVVLISLGVAWVVERVDPFHEKGDPDA